MDSERKTFMFFRSFYESAKQLTDEQQRAEFFMMLCAYALDGEEPSAQGVPAAMFQLVKPNLDIGIEKSKAGASGGKAKRKQNEANAKQTEAEQKQNEANANRIKDKGIRIKDKGSRSKDTGDPPQPPQGFDAFWQAYPRKIGKQAALKTWSRLKPNAELTKTIVNAVEYQRNSEQWRKNNGQFIPHPATWLNQGRWEDELPDAEHDHPVYAPSSDMERDIERMAELAAELAAWTPQEGGDYGPD